MKKKCQKCKKEFDADAVNFNRNPSKKDGLTTECRSCNKKYCKEYYYKNRDKVNSQNKVRGKIRYEEARLKCLTHYSNGTPQCECCKETKLEFLAINHINGGGNKERKEFKGARSYFEFLVKTDFPDHLNVLCHNCNMALGFYGYCPHNKNICVKG